MFTALVVLLFSANGYSAAVESVSVDKVHVGVYTPTAEYGYVVTPTDCYLDAVYKRKKKETCRETPQN